MSCGKNAFQQLTIVNYVQSLVEFNGKTNVYICVLSLLLYYILFCCCCCCLSWELRKNIFEPKKSNNNHENETITKSLRKSCLPVSFYIWRVNKFPNEIFHKHNCYSIYYLNLIYDTYSIFWYFIFRLPN